MASTDNIKRYRETFRSPPQARSAQNTRSVTVKQLQSACSGRKQQGRYVLNNSLIYTVRLCGRLVYIDQEEAHTNYIIDDGTGAVKGRIWSTSKSGKTHLSGSNLQSYYEIIANVVMEGGAILLQTVNAEQIKDHNRITMHLLQAIHEDFSLGQLTNEQVNRWEKAEKEAAHASKTSIAQELDKEAIVSFLASDNVRATDSGATSKQICSELQLEIVEGMQRLQEMLNEGSIYNTTDDDHFKLADNS